MKQLEVRVSKLFKNNNNKKIKQKNSPFKKYTAICS